MDPKAALEKAIALAGTQTAFAAALGPTIKTGHVYHWLKQGRLPAEHCPIVEEVFGVRCEELRPDVAWGVLRNRAPGDNPQGRPCIDVAAPAPAAQEAA